MTGERLGVHLPPGPVYWSEPAERVSRESAVRGSVAVDAGGHPVE